MNFSRIRRAFLIGAIASVTGAMFVTSAGYAAGFTGTVTIVHINDVHANVAETDKQIGYAKIAGFVEQTRAANPNTLFLDAGDVIAGNPYASIDRGLGFVHILNTLGLNAMTAGNSEFAYGSEHLRKFADGLNYPLLVDNMVSRETGKPLSEGAPKAAARVTEATATARASVAETAQTLGDYLRDQRRGVSRGRRPAGGNRLRVGPSANVDYGARQHRRARLHRRGKRQAHH